MRQYTKIIIIIGVIILGLFVLLYFVGTNFISDLSPTAQTSTNKDDIEGASRGNIAPYFDLALSGGGRLNSLDLKDSPAVVTFWATWNADSVDQIKILDDFLSKEESSARIITINSQEDKSTAINLMKRGGYEIDTLIDQSGEVSSLYGVQVLPTTFFIDRDGKISDVHIGVLSEKDIVDKMENIIR